MNIKDNQIPEYTITIINYADKNVTKENLIKVKQLLYQLLADI